MSKALSSRPIARQSVHPFCILQAFLAVVPSGQAISFRSYSATRPEPSPWPIADFDQPTCWKREKKKGRAQRLNNPINVDGHFGLAHFVDPALVMPLRISIFIWFAAMQCNEITRYWECMVRTVKFPYRLRPVRIDLSIAASRLGAGKWPIHSWVTTWRRPSCFCRLKSDLNWIQAFLTSEILSWTWTDHNKKAIPRWALLAACIGWRSFRPGEENEP